MNKIFKNGAGFGSFCMSLYPGILHTLRVVYDRETLIEPVICLKRFITIAFGSYEPFHLG